MLADTSGNVDPPRSYQRMLCTYVLQVQAFPYYQDGHMSQRQMHSGGISRLTYADSWVESSGRIRVLVGGPKGFFTCQTTTV